MAILSPAVSFSAVERAFYYAVRLLLRMDQSAGNGNAIHVPEVMVWAIEGLKPNLINPLREASQSDRLIELLRHYDSLREIAESMRVQAHYDACFADMHDADDYGYLGIDEMVYALDHGEWECGDTEARASIERVVRAVHRRYAAGEHHLESPQSAQVPAALLVPGEVAADLWNADASLLPSRAPDNLSAMARALRHAKRELLACDCGNGSGSWDLVYTRVLGQWLEVDLPEVAAEILATGSVVEYFQKLAEYRADMCAVEEVWNRLGSPLRSLLLRTNSETEAICIIEQVVRKGRKDESDVALCTGRVWDMVRRRAAAGYADSVPLSTINGTNEAIEAIRASGEATCHFVDTVSLPERVASQTGEKHALVVRLPQVWRQAESEFEKRAHLECFFLSTAGSNDTRSAISFGQIFWCDREGLWPRLFRFRRHIPVLYVFDDDCVFAHYPFAHFVDLRACLDIPVRQWGSREIPEDGWRTDRASQWFATELEQTDARLFPAVLNRVVDYSAVPIVDALGDAYLAENPDAALSPAERIVRSRFGDQG
ncbi:hypothetical protein [Paraburkholderia pallida]|uniref:Uncharacterized protein n=1 Tax=Paraburkholderia pallida TaxID=2547399 RepID=A0A4P7D9S5_9BURK|nr:hypothetical protein [Paraburkholderia pallida]QBR03614.1 hypothetical protein E1956_41625 [Paraburkholderia pallida]